MMRPEKIFGLASYFYTHDAAKLRCTIQQLEKASGGVPWEIIVDSGAYTAFTLGKSIQIDQYAEFVIETRPFVKWHFTLDVVGDPKRTLENYRYLLSSGVHVVPIITLGCSVGNIREYLKTAPVIDGLPLIGIGGTAKLDKNTKIRYYNWVHEVAPESHKHLLGCSNEPMLRYYKPYSVDSTSWLLKCCMGKDPKYSRHSTSKIGAAIGKSQFYFKKRTKRFSSHLSPRFSYVLFETISKAERLRRRIGTKTYHAELPKQCNRDAALRLANLLAKAEWGN